MRALTKDAVERLGGVVEAPRVGQDVPSLSTSLLVPAD